MGWRLLLLSAILALAAIAAGDAPLDRATLRGITAINVVIDPISPDVQAEDVAASDLKARLEERLGDAGIHIDASSTQFVALRLTAVNTADKGMLRRGSFALAASIALYQPVTLVRDPKVKTATQTWEVDTVVLAGPKQVRQACFDSVDQLAGRFVAAYRAVNGGTGTASRDKDQDHP